MEKGEWKLRLEKKAWMSPEDVELFLRFAEDAALHMIGDKRIEKYRTDLCIAHEMSQRDLLGMVGSLEGLKATIFAINSDHAYSFASKADAKRTLGSLYSFHHNNDRSLRYANRELKELVAHRAKAKDRRLAKPILTRLEMREILQYGNTLDRAIVSTLFDSGMRIGEFIQLKKSDLTQIEEGIEIRVPAGKTGERIVVVVEAKQYLNSWLGEHPVKDADAPLWMSPDKHKPITGPGISRRIREAVKRLNEHRLQTKQPLFTAPTNPHNWRHSRASELGGEPGMTEQILCKYFGWEIGSDMPRTYLHLTDEQVKRAVLRVHGKAREEEPKQIETHRVCRLCKAQNPLGLAYCGQCGKPLAADEQVSRMSELTSKVGRIEGLLARLAERLDLEDDDNDGDADEGEVLLRHQVREISQKG